MATDIVRDLRNIGDGDILGYIAFDHLRIHHRIDIYLAETECVNGLETLKDGILGNQLWIILPEYLPTKLDDHFPALVIDFYHQ